MTVYTVRAKKHFRFGSFKIAEDVSEGFSGLIEAIDYSEELVKQGYKVKISAKSVVYLSEKIRSARRQEVVKK